MELGLCEARQVGAPALDQLDATVRSGLGPHRHAGSAKGIDVAVDRAPRHLQPRRELRSAEATSGLEHQQHCQDAVGAHSSQILTEDGNNCGAYCGHEDKDSRQYI